jgi:hypothetical protein
MRLREALKLKKGDVVNAPKAGFRQPHIVEWVEEHPGEIKCLVYMRNDVSGNVAINYRLVKRLVKPTQA